MLTITPTAAQAIEAIVASEGEEAGIRITQEPADDGQVGLALTVAPAPEAEDQVVVEEGARVFLPPDAAELLDDMALDAQIEGTSVGFKVREQA